MRTKLMASVAAALLGLSATAFASSSYQAEASAAAVITGGVISPGTNDTDVYASIGDQARGSQLAGIVQAKDYGVTGLNAFATNYANAIINDNTTNNNSRYAGDEAYGVARYGQSFGSVTATSAVANYYAAVVAGTHDSFYDGGNAIANNVDSHIAYVLSPVSDPSNPDTFGLWSLSHHVLASNIVGASSAGQYAGGLITALGNWNITGAGGTDTLDRDTNFQVSSVEALATALWALKTVGTSDATVVAGSGSDLDGLVTGDGADSVTLAEARDLLIGRLTASSYAVYQHLGDNLAVGTDASASGYAEDIAYGILALKAFNAGGTYDAQIAELEQRLAAAILANSGNTPLNVDVNTGAYSAQYAGAALQALPEPATLSLLALGGLGLLARRRRQA